MLSSAMIGQDLESEHASSFKAFMLVAGSVIVRIRGKTSRDLTTDKWFQKG